MVDSRVRLWHRIVRFFTCAVCAWCFVVFSSQVRAKEIAYTVILNQVRGRECCQVGSVDALKKQLQALKTEHLPATFVLRYDVLSDAEMMEPLRAAQNIEIGALLEITPQLARTAEVPYKGPEDRWHKAENAFLVGYAVDDRKKLIDTFFSAYKNKFGVTPVVTAGWMLDAWSLNYLDEVYGVKVHELTREQWGTDSYTLYGGPVLLPYYPSRNWPLIPASEATDSARTLIVRQTIPDSIRAYGDLTSAYTSQPNDYFLRKDTLQYFERVYGDALSAKPFGFGVIGLENSMDPEFQDEFVRQLQVVSKARDTGKTDAVFASDLPDNIGQSDVYVYAANKKRENQWAAWIGSQKYRARISLVGDQVALTDLRVYSDAFTDPYAAVPLDRPNGYWVVPFLLDGSRFFQKKESTSSLFSSDQEKRERAGPVLNERFTRPDALLLPNIRSDAVPQVEYDDAYVKMTYPSVDGDSIVVIFTPSGIAIDLARADMLSRRISSSALQKLWDSGDVKFEQTEEKEGEGVRVTFTFALREGISNTDLANAHPDLLKPESGGAFSFDRSNVVYKGTRAVLGRNPFRIVLYAADDQGRPAYLENLDINVSPEENAQVSIQHPETSRGEYYVDIDSSVAGEFQPKLLVDGREKVLGVIRFVPNCKEDMMFCLQHPAELFQYIMTRIEDLWYRR